MLPILIDHLAGRRKLLQLTTYALFGLLALGVLMGCDRPHRVKSYPDPERVGWRLEDAGSTLGLFTTSGDRWSLACSGEDLSFHGPRLDPLQVDSVVELAVGGAVLRVVQFKDDAGWYGFAALSDDGLKRLSAGGEVNVTARDKTVSLPKLPQDLATSFVRACQPLRKAAAVERQAFADEGGMCGALQRENAELRTSDKASRWKSIAEVEKDWMTARCGPLR